VAAGKGQTFALDMNGIPIPRFSRPCDLAMLSHKMEDAVIKLRSGGKGQL
jgi:hypothetical protein